mmetsp:Transcript_33911/g.107606  ORF Transcript_33911/g.107606 Transcript_33911/m.107606 type:complete len:231 (-) Transcript_33911:439-1131(-)
MMVDVCAQEGAARARDACQAEPKDTNTAAQLQDAGVLRVLLQVRSVCALDIPDDVLEGIQVWLPESSGTKLKAQTVDGLGDVRRAMQMQPGAASSIDATAAGGSHAAGSGSRADRRVCTREDRSIALMRPAEVRPERVQQAPSRIGMPQAIRQGRRERHIIGPVAVPDGDELHSSGRSLDRQLEISEGRRRLRARILVLVGLHTQLIQSQLDLFKRRANGGMVRQAVRSR